MHYIIYRDKNLCGINLCDQCLTCIIRINKTLAENVVLCIYVDQLINQSRQGEAKC